MEPEDKKEQAHRKSAAAAALRRLDGPENEGDHQGEDTGSHRTRKEDLELNQYEQMIAMEVVAPEDIPVSFEGEGAGMCCCLMYADLRGAGRHRWPRPDYRRAQRISHLSADDATPLCTLIVAIICALGRSTVWPPGLRKDNVSKGLGQ